MEEAVFDLLTVGQHDSDVMSKNNYTCDPKKSFYVKFSYKSHVHVSFRGSAYDFLFPCELYVIHSTMIWTFCFLALELREFLY